jgi:hypothetical protein
MVVVVVVVVIVIIIIIIITITIILNQQPWHTYSTVVHDFGFIMTDSILKLTSHLINQQFSLASAT